MNPLCQSAFRVVRQLFAPIALVVMLSAALPAGSAQALSGVLASNSPCLLPGPLAPDRCTVNITWQASGAPMYCLWYAGPGGSGPYALNSCEGHSNWALTYSWVTQVPSVMQLRAHWSWPTLHPAWPSGIETILAETVLLDEEIVVASNGNLPPSVSLTINPIAGLIAPATTTVAAVATDDRGIASVSFYANGSFVGIDFQAPYEFYWSGIAAGNYSVIARAVDTDGASTDSSPVNMTVAAPTVATGTLATNSPCYLPGPISPDRCTINYSWTSANSPVTCVWIRESSQLYACEGGISQGSSQFDWVFAFGGTLDLRAHANWPTLDPDWPNMAAVLSRSTLLASQFVWAQSAVNSPPVVSVSANPSLGLVAPAVTVLTAQASDSDGTVVNVRFFDGGQLLATVTQPPFQFTWSGIPAGSHSVTAVATDNSNASTTSSPLSLQVAPPGNSGCSTTVASGGSIANAIEKTAAPATICLLGTYQIANTVVVPSRITIKGVGAVPQETVVSATSSLQGAVFQVQFAASDVSIENLRIVSNGSQQTQLSAVAVEMNLASRIALRSLDMSNTYRMTVAINMSTDVLVADSTFAVMGLQDCGACALGAFWINNSMGVTVERNVVTGRNNGPGGDGGIDCYGSTDVIVRDNSIFNAGESAIYSTYAGNASQACRNIRITGNYVRGSNEWGIDMRGLDGAYIANNRIENSRFGAMSMWEISNSLTENNAMFNNRTSGDRRMCQGINLNGYQINNIYRGSTGNGTLICNFVP